MPTDPSKPLFDPDVSKKSAEKQIDAAVALIAEVRNHGHYLFDRCADRPAGGDENLVILFMFYHLIEMVDAVGVLVAESALAPAQLTVRAAFEALLALDFILRDDTVRRAHAYLVCDIMERLDFYSSLDPATETGKELRAAMAADPDCAHMSLASPRPEAAESLRTTLTYPMYKEAFEEFERLRKGGRRYPSWHELWGGPRSIRQLAKALGRQGSYEILYGGWSATGHATDVIRRNLVESNGGPGVRPIRNPALISSVVNMAVNFYLDAARLVLRKYRPAEGRQYSEWYVSEVRKLWFAVDGQEAPQWPPDSR